MVAIIILAFEITKYPVFGGNDIQKVVIKWQNNAFVNEK
jgi:hypothetical protein